MRESNGNTKGDQDQDLGVYFLELCRRKEESDDVDEEEESPSELNTKNSSGGFVVVSTDKLSLKYTSVNLHGPTKPAPTKRLVCYFEVHVKDAGVKGQISIGFTSENFKMRNFPPTLYFSFSLINTNG